MANEVRLIDANEPIKKLEEHRKLFIDAWQGFAYLSDSDKARVDEIDTCIAEIANAPTVDAYTEEQIASIVKKVKQLEISNQELETDCAWLKSCLNCKIRRECPRHCGKVVHDCDHWVCGDNAVEVVHGRWVRKAHDGAFGVFHLWHCSVCDTIRARQDPYCGECGAKMEVDNG